jgi:hypothetical protein
LKIFAAKPRSHVSHDLKKRFFVAYGNIQSLIQIMEGKNKHGRDACKFMEASSPNMLSRKYSVFTYWH